MQMKFNPLTSRLDLVGTSGGGGSGTVTSVSEGAGIQATPNPIVGAGSIALDIASLTLETTLEAGDLFAFVDSSEGTDPTDQRAIDYADVLAAIAGDLVGVFQPLDAGLTALSSLGAGIAVSDGADGWVARTLAVTDSATIDFTLTNGSGVGGNPTITAAVIQAALDHGSIGGLTDDDHLQYFLLAGRPVGQVGFGSSVSGNPLTFASNPSHDAPIILDNTATIDSDVILFGAATDHDITFEGPTTVKSLLTIHDHRDAIVAPYDSETTATLLLQKYASNRDELACRIYFSRSRGTMGSETVVQDGDALGRIDFLGFGGTIYRRAVRLLAEVDDGAPDDTEMGGRFSIQTAGTPGALTDRLSIDSAGYSTFSGSVGIRNVLYTWPAANASGVLTNNGAGTLSWAAASAGTVTSVAGGVGITNTPEPIIGAGTVDLDINSLTAETALASGDLLAFVDVSVGTTPSSQRKMTAANLAVGLRALSPLIVQEGDVDVDTNVSTLDFIETDGTLVTSSPAGEANINMDLYFLRSGRPTGRNSYILSSDTSTALLSGGTSGGQNVDFESTTSGTKGTIQFRDPLRFFSSPPSTLPALNAIVTVDTNMTLATGSASTFRYYNHSHTLTMQDNITALAGLRFVPTISSGASTAFTLGTEVGLIWAPTYTPGSSASMTGLTFRGSQIGPTLSNAGTGNTATIITGLHMAGASNTNWTTDDWNAVNVLDPTGSGGTITRLGGVHLANLTRGTSNYSLWSEGASVFLAHSGPAIFGAAQTTLTAPNTGITLDVSGTVALRRIGDVTLVNGSNTGVNVGTTSFARVVGPTAAYTIHGITGGVDGRVLILYNTVAFNMTLANQSGTEGTAANRIITMSGANQATNAEGAAILIYDSSVSRWIVLTLQQ